MDTIEVNNLSFSYDNVYVFDRLSFCIKKGYNTSIVGPSGCGKTTLAKILDGNLKYSGSIKINGVEIVKDNFYLLKRYICVIFNEKYSNNNSIIDELFNSLNDLNLSVEEEKTRVNDIISYFKLGNILESKVSSFSKSYRNYLHIIKELVRKSSYILFDDVFINMEDSYVKNILKYCKENDITVINITTDMESVLASNYMIVLYNKNIAMEGDVLECLKEEKLLNRLGFNLPFLVELSIKLGYYGLINEVITDERKMIKTIWK